MKQDLHATTAPEVLVGEHASVMIITINRPQAKNAVTEAVSEGIAEALDELDSRNDLSVGIITGAAGTFCAGLDLRAFLLGERPSISGRGFAGITEARRASRSSPPSRATRSRVAARSCWLVTW